MGKIPNKIPNKILSSVAVGAAKAGSSRITIPSAIRQVNGTDRSGWHSPKRMHRRKPSSDRISLAYLGREKIGWHGEVQVDICLEISRGHENLIYSG